MSALPPKADIRPPDQDVCFGPKALDLYSHVTETMQVDAAAKLDTAFRSAINIAASIK